MSQREIISVDKFFRAIEALGKTVNSYLQSTKTAILREMFLYQSCRNLTAFRSIDVCLQANTNIDCFYHLSVHLVVEAVTRRYSVTALFLEIRKIKNTCVRATFLIKLRAWACNFIKRETLTHVFSSEFLEISHGSLQVFIIIMCEDCHRKD